MMAIRMSGSASIFSLAAVAVVLAGCSSSTPVRDLNIVGQVQPQPAAPVETSTVAQTALPPLGAVQGAPAPSLVGQPVLGGAQAQQTALTGSPVSLDPLASSVPLGPEGVWTAIAGASQCRVNLTLTAREGTTRNRASAPGCVVPGLAMLGSWQQVGNQIQLFDDSGNLVAALAQSGQRYIGTLTGGQALSIQR